MCAEPYQHTQTARDFLSERKCIFFVRIEKMSWALVSKTATRKKHFFKTYKLWTYLAMADSSFRRVLGQHVEPETQQQGLLGLVTPNHPDFRQALDGRIMPRSHGYAVAHRND